MCSSQTIWGHRTGSSLAPIMVCFVTAPSYHLNQSKLSYYQWGSVAFAWKQFSLIHHLLRYCASLQSFLIADNQRIFGISNNVTDDLVAQGSQGIFRPQHLKGEDLSTSYLRQLVIYDYHSYPFTDIKTYNQMINCLWLYTQWNPTAEIMTGAWCHLTRRCVPGKFLSLLISTFVAMIVSIQIYMYI